MKKKLLKFSIPVILFVIVGIIISLLTSFLSYKSIIKPITGELITSSTSSLLFFIFAIYIGLKVKKRGLLIGISLFIIYLIFNLTLKGLDDLFILPSLIFFFIKSFLLIIGSVIGVNIAQKI